MKCARCGGEMTFEPHAPCTTEAYCPSCKLFRNDQAVPVKSVMADVYESEHEGAEEPLQGFQKKHMIHLLLAMRIKSEKLKQAEQRALEMQEERNYYMHLYYEMMRRPFRTILSRWKVLLIPSRDDGHET